MNETSPRCVCWHFFKRLRIKRKSPLMPLKRACKSLLTKWNPLSSKVTGWLALWTVNESLHFSCANENDPLQDRSFGSKSGDRWHSAAHVHETTLGLVERQAGSVEGESIADQSESGHHRGEQKRFGLSWSVLEEFSLWRSVVNTVLSSCHRSLKGEK